MRAKSSIFGLAAAVALAACGGTKVIKNGDTLVFMGDSITQYGKDSPVGYLPLVAAGLAANGVNVTWIGAGHAGDTAVDMKNRFQRDVIAAKPQVVTILAGVNDCSQGWPNNSASGPNDVAAMADMAIAAGIKPVLFSPTGSGLESFPQNVKDYAAQVKQIAQARGVPYGATHEAFRAYVEDSSNPKTRFDGKYYHKATVDGLHMDVLGNRIIAREMMKALGFDSTEEMAKSEAAWNAIPAAIPLSASVKITAAEFLSIRVAAAKAGKAIADYQQDLFYRGVTLMKQSPKKVTATGGANVEFSAAPLVNLVTYDEMVECTRQLGNDENMPNAVNYALLAAVHELPTATEQDLPKEPVVQVNTSAFSKSVTFTCSGYAGSSTLADFPVAVRLAAGSPQGFAYSDMANSSKGNELRFADSTGRSFPYEIESWNPNGTSLIWVKVPSLTKTTSFTMYYGGTPKESVDSLWTWAADYVGVWHMVEEGGTVADSSGNGLNAVPKGNDAANQAAEEGVFGKARRNARAGYNHFTGSAMMQVDDSIALDVGGDFTFSGWIKMTGFVGEEETRIVCRNKDYSSATDWELALTDYSTLVGSVGSSSSVSGTIPSAQNSWVHIVGVFNGATLTAYANGAKAFEQTITPVQDTNNKMIFGAGDPQRWQGHFVGLFDEFRLRDAVCSADWVKAEYDQAGGKFLAAGAVQDLPDTPPDDPPDNPQDDDPQDEPTSGDADENWIRESATTFGSTGTWTGDRAVVASGKISVSNATFAATKQAPRSASVTIASTFDFCGSSDEPVVTSSRAGIWVVEVGGVSRYAVQTATGLVTNGTVVASVGSPVRVTVTLDDAAHTVAYSVAGANLGTYPMSAKQTGVSTVRYEGATDVDSLDGAYRSEKTGVNLGEPTARPQADYNGSVVTVAFAGDVPVGATVTAKVTLGGVDYVGSVDTESGIAAFTLPDDVVTAGNTYSGTVTVTVDGVDYSKGVAFAQGTLKVDEDADWICESAESFGATGTWTGDRVAVADGRISVSNATFTAAQVAPESAVVTISSTFEFCGPSEDAFETSSRTGLWVVDADGVNRYAILTPEGVVTNLAVVANVGSPVRVTATLDNAAHTVAYSVAGATLGTYPTAEKSAGVSTIRYVGATDVAALNGAYRYEELDANLAKVGDTEYATVAEAVAAAGSGTVNLLWDASWTPTKAGAYKIAKGGFVLAIGGDLAYSVKDNGDGTVTVTVAGGDESAPAPASITFSGSVVKVGVADVKPDLWYALEKTTDLTKPFEVDESTWTKGSDLIGGDKELAIMLLANEPQAFYRVVVATEKP